MFGTARTEALNAGQWQAKGGFVEFVEAWQYEDFDDITSDTFRHGILSDEKEIYDWISSETLPASQPPIESKFRLHPSTLPSFENEQGVHFRFVELAPDGKTAQRIYCVLKAPQKREICNWGLSLSYDVATGTTTALLYGTAVLLSRMSTLRKISARSMQHVLDALCENVALWNRSMLLPCLLLGEHMIRTKIFCVSGTPVKETVSIEHELGVTKVGQSAYFIEDVDEYGETVYKYQNGHESSNKNTNYRLSVNAYPSKLSREETERLTVRINTQSTRLIFTSRSSLWNIACSKYIIKILDDLAPRLVGTKGAAESSDYLLKEMIEANMIIGESVASQVDSLQARMSLQLEVLYNIVAQMDNKLSAELAVSAGRDSTSMKILAFISALFLPGSFLASIFSMSVFDWQAHGGDGDEVVSDRFWIYWAVAVPLTTVTILGWGIWWRMELSNFNSRVRKVRGDESHEKATKSPKYDLEGAVPKGEDEKA